jgi:hypothetical protein
MKYIEVSEYVPDELDIQCEKVMNILNAFFITSEEKIGILEQVIDYLRMDIAYNDEEK